MSEKSAQLQTAVLLAWIAVAAGVVAASIAWFYPLSDATSPLIVVVVCAWCSWDAWRGGIASLERRRHPRRAAAREAAAGMVRPDPDTTTKGHNDGD